VGVLERDAESSMNTGVFRVTVRIRNDSSFASSFIFCRPVASFCRFSFSNGTRRDDLRKSLSEILGDDSARLGTHRLGAIDVTFFAGSVLVDLMAAARFRASQIPIRASAVLRSNSTHCQNPRSPAVIAALRLSLGRSTRKPRARSESEPQRLIRQPGC
jgi:hypothetical protein